MSKKPQLFFRSGGSSGALVRYTLYTAKPRKNLKTIYMPKKPSSYKGSIDTSATCFSSMHGLRQKANDKFNRLAYHLNPGNGSQQDLTKKERLHFLQLCQDNKFLPDYVNIKHVNSRMLLVLDIHAHTNNMLYVYFSAARLLETDPKLVKNILELVDNFNVDFCLAMVTATCTGMHNMNHMFLPAIPGTYGGAPDFDNLKIPLHIAAGLYALVNELAFVKGPKNSNWGFNCNSTVEKVYEKKLTKPLLDILGKDIYNSITRSKNQAEYKELVIKEKDA